MDPLERPAQNIDQEIRINELRETANELAEGEMTSWENEDTPPDIAEQFWQNVVAFENSASTCHFDQLTERGIELPPAAELEGEVLAEKLWEVINELAKLDVYLSSTDHLSDRELYTHLWEELLREETPDFPPGSGWQSHIDILGGCSEEDIYLQHKYYADEEQRQRWQSEWPDDPMPDHVNPPHDRDRHLPKPPEHR